MSCSFFIGFSVGFVAGAFSMFAAFLYWTIHNWINEKEEEEFTHED